MTGKDVGIADDDMLRMLFSADVVSLLFSSSYGIQINVTVQIFRIKTVPKKHTPTTENFNQASVIERRDYIVIIVNQIITEHSCYLYYTLSAANP